MASITATLTRKLHATSTAIFDKTVGEGRINWPALALARFVLAFIVAAAHIYDYTTVDTPLTLIRRLDAFQAILGFLLISGLSIGHSILKNAEGYYIRRAQRIYPVYLVCIALHYAVVPEPFTWNLITKLLANIFFLNQAVTETSYIGPAWTLALEVWLYALAPLFLRASYKTMLTITAVSFFSYVVYTCSRTLLDTPYYAGVSYGLNLLFLSFIWTAGFMLAIFKHKTKAISLIVTLILVTQWFLNTAIQIAYRIKNNQVNELWENDALDFFMRAICLLFIYYMVVGNKKIPTFSPLSRKVADFLGNISYPLYLSNFAVLILCERFAITNWIVLTFCCLLVASLIYQLFDFYSKKRTA
ncbi:acyltransferase [Hymenobacter tibetensis]|uniref:Acyltransferase n=1 Tax=Hymenobacter tibetensis TaxID=497967 RepID=A0ABY4CVC3_9BACT|nr:acyltransferase [Hymenobacter tibetensis]UOG74056.1 acyltransferase [Hymenobacter tibetensis]